MRRTMIRNSNKNHLRENVMRRKSLLEYWLEDEDCYDCDKEDWELDEEHCNLYGGDPTYCPECHERLSYGDGYPHCLNPECGRYSPIDFDESVSEKEMRDSIKHRGHEKFVKELSNDTANGYKKALQYVYDQDTLSKDDFKKKYFDESIEVGKKVKVKDSKETGKVVKNAGEDVEINKVKMDKSGKVVEYSDSDLEVLDEAYEGKKPRFDIVQEIINKYPDSDRYYNKIVKEIMSACECSIGDAQLALYEYNDWDPKGIYFEQKVQDLMSTKKYSRLEAERALFLGEALGVII